jgi:TonB family protein
VARAAPESTPAPSVAAPALPAAPAAPAESPFAGRTYSLLRPQLDVPPLPRVPGGGGTRPEGEGAGESGSAREGQAAIPLDKPPDADHAEYFLKVKKAIEEHWSYPTEAARKGQSGQLVLELVIRKDGNVAVRLVNSSGVEILDRYALNAVKWSAPFPPLPDRFGEHLPISASFTYLLDHGFRVFGLR